MRIIAFINDGPEIREILGHLGELTSAPRIAPARGPPLWELPVAGQAERGNRSASTTGTGLRVRSTRRLVGAKTTQRSRLVADDSCLKAQCRRNSTGLEPTGVGSAWAGAVSGRNSRLTWGERRGDTCFGFVEIPICPDAKCHYHGHYECGLIRRVRRRNAVSRVDKRSASTM